MEKLNKKGAISLGSVPSTVWIVVLIGIMLGVGAIVLGEFVDQADATLDSAGENETITMINDTLVSMQTFADWMPIIILVVVIGIVVTVLMSALAFGGRR